jgi:hypothetical protein
MVSGEQINHLAMGHHINHPKKPYVPNTFVCDIIIERHFLPDSYLEHIPNAIFEATTFYYVLGVFLLEETKDNTELLIDYKDLHILKKEQ